MRALNSLEKLKIYTTFRSEFKTNSSLAIFNAILSVFEMQGLEYNHLLEAIKNSKGEKGEPGEATDKNEILDELRDFILEKMDRFKPADGYSPTEEDIVPIIKKLMPKPVPGPKGDQADPLVVASYLLQDPTFITKVQGAPGETPSEKNLTAIIKKLIPKAIEVTGKNIISQINSLPIESPLQIGIEHVKGLLDELRTIKKNGKPGKQIHGGGITKVVHDTTLSGDGTLQSPLKVIGGTGGGVVTTELKNIVLGGSGNTFTIPDAFLVGTQEIFIRGQETVPGPNTYSISGQTVTTADTLQAGDVTADYTVSVGSATGILIPTEVPDGTRTVFTFPTATAQPTFIVKDDAMTRPITKGGTVIWSWNNTLQQATFIKAPNDEVVAIP